MTFDYHAAYDELNADDHDYRFYAAFADELSAHRVLDLGCGTGTLARLMASAGHQVVAIDPDEDMLRIARSKPGAELVEWRTGYSDAAETGRADLAVMSGHVAQLFVDDSSWASVLGDLHRALTPGGTLAFESRNPVAKRWERWTRDGTLRTVSTDEGPVEFWHQTEKVSLPAVTYATYDRNLVTGTETCTRETLAFRDAQAIVESLDRAGYTVTSMFGDWARGPVTDTSPEVIVIAGRR
jgi:2-polyprenyl-3-methyl-5-hydroxy-6-metoxy-1,4-benzoquinol methylase